MIRLHDARAGRPVELRPAVPRFLRVRVSGGLRVCLVGDLVRRVVEHHAWRVAVLRDDAEGAGMDLAALNIHAAADVLPGDAADVRVLGSSGGQGSALPAPGQPLTIVVAPARILAGAPDPLALRLALLGVHYRVPAEIDDAVLDGAAALLGRWRAAVARWAESPSRPMCAEYVQRAYAAYEDDLDTPAALQVLAALEGDESIPPGSKFETFVHLDRLLGLDLASDIGAPGPRA